MSGDTLYVRSFLATGGVQEGSVRYEGYDPLAQRRSEPFPLREGKRFTAG